MWETPRIINETKTGLFGDGIKQTHEEVTVWTRFHITDRTQKWADDKEPEVVKGEKTEIWGSIGGKECFLCEGSVLWLHKNEDGSLMYEREQGIIERIRTKLKSI